MATSGKGDANEGDGYMLMMMMMMMMMLEVASRLRAERLIPKWPWQEARIRCIWAGRSLWTKSRPKERPQGGVNAELVGTAPVQVRPIRLQEEPRYPRQTQSRPLITKW